MNDYSHDELLPFAVGVLAGNWFVQLVAGGAAYFSMHALSTLGAFLVVGGIHCAIRRGGF